jgi:hypothetical protein
VFVSTQKGRYILPVVPASALIAAYLFAEAQPPRPIVCSDIGPDLEGNTLAANDGEPLTMQFTESTGTLSQADPAAICICREQDLGGLPPELRARMRVLMRGPLAGKPCVLFSLTPPANERPSSIGATHRREVPPRI